MSGVSEARVRIPSPGVGSTDRGSTAFGLDGCGCVGEVFPPKNLAAQLIAPASVGSWWAFSWGDTDGEGVTGSAFSAATNPSAGTVPGKEPNNSEKVWKKSLKSTNIQLGREVPGGRQRGVADGVQRSARSRGGVFRTRAVPGEEILHFEKM